MTAFRSEAAPGGLHRFDASGSAGDLEPGPLSLAGDLFLIMLDDATGRLRVRTRIAGYALAGALLVELRRPGHVAFDAERIQVLGHTAPGDPVLARLWARLVDEPADREIVAWLEYLATVAVDEVADQLVAARWIRRRARLGLSGRREVFVPRNRNAVFWRAGRLAGDLGRDPSWEDLYLAGLLDAVGAVDQTLGGQRGPEADRIVRMIGECLSLEAPQVAIVCGHVQALSARAAITLR